jgi:hypothetical protein
MLESDTIAGSSAGPGGAPGDGGAGPTPGASGTAGTRGTGGGVLDPGAFVTMQNTLLASDPGGNCATPLVTNGGHNLSFGDSSCPSTFLSGDPNLGPLQDNGGPSWTIDLGTGSAAIDQIPATGAGCPATDQRGVVRPAGPMCDIGAYEVAPPTATTLKATAIKNTSAMLNATVTPNAGPSAVVAFEYGPTTRYGKKIVVANVSGVLPAAVTAPITRLKSGTTYHYRVTVTTSDGSANGADATFTAGSAPVLSKLRIRGLTITYRDSQAAKTTFKIVRGKGRHTRTVATVSHHDKKGANKVRFNKLHLKRGRYTLVATPRFRGQTGAPVSARIRIR